jgi:hypothetical protein
LDVQGDLLLALRITSKLSNSRRGSKTTGPGNQTFDPGKTNTSLPGRILLPNPKLGILPMPDQASNSSMALRIFAEMAKIF